ncbi:MAG TPA: ABC transporter permease, partial [Acidobacteriota bacterium]
MNFSLWRRRREENLEEEIQSHLKMAIQERMERGESAEQAQYSARREFGNVGLVKEVARDMWGWTSLERLAQDLRYALRALRKSPGFTSVAVLCLALGIGANTTVFSLIEATLLRMLPVKEPERLVLVENSQGQRPRSSSFSYPHFAYMREHSNLTDIFAYSHISLNLSAGALTDSPSGQLVSDNYFTVLGVRPALGRGFVPGDEAVAVISYRFWKSRFRGDPGIVGRSVSLNGVPFTLVGVTPQRFFGIEAGTSPDIFVPLLMCDRLEQGKPRLPMPNRFWLGVMGRLQAGVSMEQAGAEANVIYQQATTELARALPPNKLVRYLRGMRITLAPGNKGTASLRKQFGKPLLILMTVVALVLLIACANVASLLLARAANRQREMAIRAALGAGRTRLLRQVLTESIVLSLAGGLLGLLFAFWGTETLVKLLARNMLDASPDIRVLGFTLAVSMLTGLLFGAVPGLQATRSNLTSALKEEPASRAPRRRFGLRNLLVVGQVAVSLFLLIGAGLFIRTLANLKYLDTGFHADNVLLVSLNPGLSRYSPERTRSFYDQ